MHCKGKDYLDKVKFAPSVYLQTYYYTFSDDSFAGHMLRCLFHALQVVPKNVTVLDYGCGPSLLPTIAASSKASEIILSDYSDNNIRAIRQWLDKDPHAFDWSPHFKYVVQELEGEEIEEVIKRQEKVRKMVKDVVRCDLTEDPLIEKGYNRQYNVVICSLVLDTVAQTIEDFISLLSRIGALIKPGGCLLLYSAEDASHYIDGDSTFEVFPLTTDSVLTAMNQAGYKDVQLNDEKYTTPIISGLSYTFFFVKGTR